MTLRLTTLLGLLLVACSSHVQAQGLFSEVDPELNGNSFPPLTESADVTDPTDEETTDQDEQADNVSKPIDQDDDLPPYYFPQSHQFERPMYVGSDQLQVYRGYWQPGGYDQRAGSPFFFSVPNGPLRGPLAGNGPGPAATGMYGTNGAVASAYGYSSYPYNGGYAGYNSYGNGGYGPAGYSSDAGMYGYNNGGYGNMSGYGGGGAGGGAGGDPYGYHFGPGFYRSGEYGHFRFPYYSYRRPWYHPGFPGYNRDVNLPW